MKEKIIGIPYAEFASLSEMNNEDIELATKAMETAQNAYAPYSGFFVGAAVRLDNGQILTGNNQENAAYPSGLCAERVVLFWAGSQFKNYKVISMAIAAFKDGVMTTEPIAPCGACRQVFAEYEHRYAQPISLILVGEKRVFKLTQSTLLLPLGFDPSTL